MSKITLNPMTSKALLKEVAAFFDGDVVSARDGDVF